MADDLDSRLKAWEARMAVKKEDERQRVDEPIPLPRNAREIVPAAATTVLVFPSGFEQPYDSHLAMTRELKMAGVYPALQVYGLTPQPSPTPAPRLVLITGTEAEMQRLPEAFYAREAEMFIARQGGDWNAINPAASVANLPGPDGTIDRRTFDAVIAELKSGKYVVSVEL
jgi:hypothetical protein